MKKTLRLTFALFSLLFLSACAVGKPPSDPVKDSASSPTESIPASQVESEPVPEKPGYTAFSWENGTKRLISENAWAARVFVLSDGSLLGGYESGNGIHTRISDDFGETWHDDTVASFCPERSCANINFYLDGDLLYLAYRAEGPDPNGYYTSLRVSVSEDYGKTWKPHSLIAEYYESTSDYRGVWEPCLGVIEGALTCFYANDSTSITSYQNIESLTWDGERWTDRTVISCGEEHDSRDGMPVWINLRDGGYALVIESTYRRGKGRLYVIQMLYSEDGTIWSEPKDVYIPLTSRSMAGAPGIAELPDGRIVVSFQTDENASEKGVSHCVMKTVVSDGTPCKDLQRKNFSEADNVFGTPEGECSVWTGIYYANGRLYAAGGTSAGAEMKYIAFPEWEE